MLIELVGLLFLVAIALIGFGYYSSTPAYSLVGFLIFFIIAIVLINNGIEYKVGMNVTDVTASQTIVSYNYSTYPDTRTIGIFWAIISFVGAILMIIHSTNRRDK